MLSPGSARWCFRSTAISRPRLVQNAIFGTDGRVKTAMGTGTTHTRAANTGHSDVPLAREFAGLSIGSIMTLVSYVTELQLFKLPSDYLSILTPFGQLIAKP